MDGTSKEVSSKETAEETWSSWALVIFLGIALTLLVFAIAIGFLAKMNSTAASQQRQGLELCIFSISSKSTCSKIALQVTEKPLYDLTSFLRIERKKKWSCWKTLCRSRCDLMRFLCLESATCYSNPIWYLLNSVLEQDSASDGGKKAQWIRLGRIY